MTGTSFLKFGLVFSSLMLGVAQASDLPLSSVPDHVRQLVTDLYPNATNAEWDYDSDDAYYEVDFKLSNLEVDLKIGLDGKLIEAKEEKLVCEIPRAILNSVLTQYPNAKIHDAHRLIKHDREWWDVDLKLENGHHRNVSCRPDGSNLF